MIHKKLILNLLILSFFTVNSGVNYNNNNKSSITNVFKNKNYQRTKSSWSGQKSTPNPNSSNNSFEYINDYLESAKKATKSYRSQIILFSLLSSYGIAYYFLHTGNNYLKNNALWSAWPFNKNLHSLLEIPQQQLAIQLLDEIKNKYNGHDNFMEALIKFKNNINKEKNNLIFYEKLYKFLEKTYLIAIFPISVENFKNIKKKLERIAYLKNIFLSWSTNIPIKAKIHVKKKRLQQRNYLQR